MSLRVSSPGRVRMENASLARLIAAAYKVPSSQISGPAWLVDQFYTVEAKMPAGAPKEQVEPMMQALLAERFGLKLHEETKEVKGFALIVDKGGPKLEVAEVVDPANRPSMEEMQAQTRKRMEAMQASMKKNGPRGPGFSSQTFGGITMPDFANALTPKAEARVVDETGLTGKYKVHIETYGDTPDQPGRPSSMP